MEFDFLNTIFVLSPANCSGKRAGMLLNRAAEFELARRLRESDGVTIGEAFSFMSGLYFRGKLAYANRFARPPAGMDGTLVIAPGHGLIPADTSVTSQQLARLAAVRVDPNEAVYRAPLARACE